MCYSGSGGGYMKTYQRSGKITLIACRTVAVVILLLVPVFPLLIELYHKYVSPFSEAGQWSLMVAFYLSVPAALAALHFMCKLLKNILADQLFVIDNVCHIRKVRWCCLEVCLACLMTAWWLPSLLIICMIMAFLCLVVTVIGQVMKAGVEIREENDLTV